MGGGPSPLAYPEQYTFGPWLLVDKKCQFVHILYYSGTDVFVVCLVSASCITRWIDSKARSVTYAISR